MDASKIEIIAYISPPIDLPHSEGGTLHISASQIKVSISAAIIKTAEDSSDVIDFDKTVTDDSGQSHRFHTFISAYDLWDSVSDGYAYLEEAYRSGWTFPKGSVLIPLAKDISIRSDGREPRVFGIVAAPQRPALLFAIQEKYFSAKADLFIHREAPYKTGHQPADSIVARLKACQSFSDTTGTLQLDTSPIMIPIHSRLILWENYQRKTVVDSEIGPTWNRGNLSQAITLTKEGHSEDAQQGVSWLKETGSNPVSASESTKR